MYFVCCFLIFILLIKVNIKLCKICISSKFFIWYYKNQYIQTRKFLTIWLINYKHFSLKNDCSLNILIRFSLSNGLENLLINRWYNWNILYNWISAFAMIKHFVADISFSILHIWFYKYYKARFPTENGVFYTKALCGLKGTDGF